MKCPLCGQDAARFESTKHPLRRPIKSWLMPTETPAPKPIETFQFGECGACLAPLRLRNPCQRVEASSEDLKALKAQQE